MVTLIQPFWRQIGLSSGNGDDPTLVVALDIRHIYPPKKTAPADPIAGGLDTNNQSVINLPLVSRFWMI